MKASVKEMQRLGYLLQEAISAVSERDDALHKARTEAKMAQGMVELLQVRRVCMHISVN